MLSWAVFFFILAMMAVFLGFGTFASSALEILQGVFYLLVVIFVVLMIVGLLSNKKPPSPPPPAS